MSGFSFNELDIQPGYDVVEVGNRIEALFDDLAAAYPDKKIIWSSWDHDKWDKDAKFLCKAFGYSRGKELFNAFGFEVTEETKPEEAETAAEPEEQPAAETDEESAEAESGEQEPEEPEEEPEDEPEEKPKKKEKPYRGGHRITFAEILFILLFLATAFCVFWILKYGR